MLQHFYYFWFGSCVPFVCSEKEICVCISKNANHSGFDFFACTFHKLHGEREKATKTARFSLFVYMKKFRRIHSMNAIKKNRSTGLLFSVKEKHVKNGSKHIFELFAISMTNNAIK